MIVSQTLADFVEARRALEAAGRRRIAFVATMGALHEGHRTLIRSARAHGDAVVVSIFVNPLQFGPNEDYARYPRPLSDDLDICDAEGVDLVLVPTVAELYPAGRQVSVNAGAMGSVLEGASRPGHFDGVLTIVLKLLHLVRPSVALFGQKDAQQVACVQRMVTDLNLSVDVVSEPTVREADGLALSSRNVFLTPAERTMACSLAAALEKAATADSVPAARIAADEILDRVQFEPAFELDYAVMVNPATFAEVPDDHTGPALFVVAAKVGSTRLIDNMSLDFAEVAAPQESVGLHA
ncbi:pantoate--beta-alanine ligase [uncultured Friedmanniella sp.]|uniref:pantoate--beta-alanine ligase n=1 Tax=uncultured Friedmanniella sp. TaxID=335381 RepID=UPI0035CB4334